MGIHDSCGSGEASPDAPLTTDQRRHADHVVICFLPDPEGVSHARHGMATWFEATA